MKKYGFSNTVEKNKNHTDSFSYIENANVKQTRLKLGGMTCINCQTRIEKRLRNTAGILSVKVSYTNQFADVTYDNDIISIKDIITIIQNMDYTVLENKKENTNGQQTVGLLIIIISLYILLEQFGILNLLIPRKLSQVNMSYGMLFLIGLITSVHCVAMCGGINLSQCISVDDRLGDNSKTLSMLRPTFLYNIGRVCSYTIIGFLVGALGNVLTFSNALQGLLKVIAGVFMIIMGINMLGIFPWLRNLNPRMPKVFARKINQQKATKQSPFIIGLLNGLMPCGPLQSMQIYALSTQSPIMGALSMFLFSLGTVPLMFGLGAFSSMMGKKFKQKAMTTGAILVAVLGLSMMSQGFRLSGFYIAIVPSSNYSSDLQAENVSIQIVDGVQMIDSTLSPGSYPTITVQQGIPVRWSIYAPDKSINGCNYKMYIPDYDITYEFQPGENMIEFTPTNTGKVNYSCWMGMIRGSIHVTEP